ncbi:MAG: hypothetical protein WC857_01830 [Candidatus Paceibacterota bacterium]|jgi:hypothetical protein
MSWWDGYKYDRVRALRDSLRLDRQQLANALLTARGRNGLKARIAFQEKQLKELLWQKRIAKNVRNAKTHPFFPPP